MSRLIRMDQTGHTTLAQWTADDPEAVEAAVAAFREELDRGYFAHGLDRRGAGRAGPRAAGGRRARDHAPADLRRLAPAVAAEPLPELAAVHWRPRADARRLDRTGLMWTAITMAHVVPFIAAGVVLFLVQPLALAGRASRASPTPGSSPSSTPSAAPTSCGREGRHPRAGRRRGALGRAAGRPRRPRGARAARADGARARARAPRRMARRARRARCSSRPGGRRVACYCVGVNDPALPSGDRIAHLLLALRADEEGFATVANLAFSGARWRVRRRLAPADAPGAGRRRGRRRGAWTPGPCR